MSLSNSLVDDSLPLASVWDASSSLESRRYLPPWLRYSLLSTHRPALCPVLGPLLTPGVKSNCMPHCYCWFKFLQVLPHDSKLQVNKSLFFPFTTFMTSWVFKLQCLCVYLILCGCASRVTGEQDQYVWYKQRKVHRGCLEILTVLNS